MTSRYTINLRNEGSATQAFHVFQQPAQFSGGTEVHGACLWSQALPSHAATGAVLTLRIEAQVFAGVQAALHRPAIGQPSGYAAAYRPVGLTQTPSSAGNEWVQPTFNPLGLRPPAPGQGVPPGAFRISTPNYAPPPFINLGAAVEVNGDLVLSSFVQALSFWNIDCSPTPRFHVQTGGFAVGAILDVARAGANASLCDFSGGASTIDVTLNADGSWSVETGA